MYYERVLAKPKSSFFLFGCRGTGKSTWVKHQFPDAHVISLLDESLYQSFLAAPELFRKRLRAIKDTEWIFVDEIQRLPQLLNEVHAAIEEFKLKFILCGSSARKLKRAGVNLLGGRALERRLYPFLPQEMGGNYSLESVLQLGSLPLIVASDEKEDQLAAYAQLYLKEEIQAEALVRNLAGFARFLPIAALSHAQAVNVTNIARDSGSARTTVEGYLQILEETLMTFRIHGFESKMRVRERKLPKLYWVDPGIVRSVLKNKGAPDAESRGALFEGVVATFLMAMKAYQKDFADEIFYWSPAEASTTEVDFLIQRGNEFIAIECKSGKTFRNDWTKGLRALSGLKGLVRRIVVCPETAPLQTEDKTAVLSFLDFVQQVQSNSLWP